MSQASRLLLHGIGIANFGLAIYYDVYHLKFPDNVAKKRSGFGGRWKFLTFINLWVQLFYFTTCLIADLSSRKSKAVKIRDTFFASVAFPIGMFVGIIFWSLWAVDRELVFPAKYDPYFPSWLNHMMHTTVLPLQFLELVLIHHAYPSRRVGGGLCALFVTAYLAWVHVVFYYGNFWVYPVLQVLSMPWRVAFMAGCAVMGVGLYLLGELFNNIIWQKPKKAD